MDRQVVLAAFDEQIRRRPEPDAPDGRVEHDDRVIRTVSAGRRLARASTWSDLDDAGADAVIAAQVARFAELGRPWEWKHYSYDQPADLPARLLAAGFTREPAEALLVAEIARAGARRAAPRGRAAAGGRGRAGRRRARGGARRGVRRGPLRPRPALLARLAQQPSSAAAVVALAGQTPIAAGRVEFHAGTDFASLWGGGTLPALARPWRVPRAGRPPRGAGGGPRLSLPPGRRLCGQPPDPRAARLRRARHHDAVHPPRRGGLTHRRPVIVSVKAKVERSSRPASVTLPVTPRSNPVPAMLVEVARKAPLATSKVPATCAVSVPGAEVKTIGPVNDAVVPTTWLIVKRCWCARSRPRGSRSWPASARRRGPARRRSRGSGRRSRGRAAGSLSARGRQRHDGGKNGQQ